MQKRLYNSTRNAFTSLLTLLTEESIGELDEMILHGIVGLRCCLSILNENVVV